MALGRMFFGESMYSACRDASKVVLVRLCDVLDAWGPLLLVLQLPLLFQLPHDRPDRRVAGRIGQVLLHLGRGGGLEAVEDVHDLPLAAGQVLG